MKEAIIHAVSEALSPVLTPLLTALILAVLYKLCEWLGIDINPGNKQALVTLARTAAAYSEEWARSASKGGSAPSGDEKAKVAMDALMVLAKGAARKWSEDQRWTAIQAALPELRAKSPAPIDHDLTQVFRP